MSIKKLDTARFSRIFVPRGKGKKRSEKFGSGKKREAWRTGNSQKIFGDLFFERMKVYL
jgi:hypothetical protein